MYLLKERTRDFVVSREWRLPPSDQKTTIVLKKENNHLKSKNKKQIVLSFLSIPFILIGFERKIV